MRRMLQGAALLCLLGAAGCDESDPNGPADAAAADAADVDASGDAGADAGADAGPALPPLARTLPPASDLGTRGGRSLARATIHLHSPLSHDACDGEGYLGGVIDEDCLGDMRRGICETRQDVVFVTDHDEFHADVPFPDVYLMREEDAPLLDPDGVQTGSVLGCPDGHRPILLTGEENELMPVGLLQHPDAATPQALHALYNGTSVEDADAMRGAGALVLIPHSEQWSAEDIEAVRAAGMELYNFHANLDRNIREQFLGLPADEAIANLLIYYLDQDHPEPDLGLTSFLAENMADLDRFDALLGRGVHLAGFGGSDAHQNSFPGPWSDGERGDSYRRFLRWMSNYLLVDEVSRDAALEALAAARLYTAFDAFGTPAGFDFRAEDGCDGRTEMGGDVTLGCEPTLVLDVPTVHGLDPSGPQPSVRAAILKVSEEGRVQVATGSHGSLSYQPLEPGVFRAVVWITPEHLRPYFHGADAAYVHEFPWVYGNALHVR